MFRIALFLGTNFAILAVASITLNLLGVGRYLTAEGLDLGALLAFCAVFGFAGSFISLFISKWVAKKTARVHVIDTPRTAEERWLVETVRDLAAKANIGMPEVGVFPALQSNAFATGGNKNNALVAVSAGMLQRFNRDEVRAVLGHEIGHVANGDMVTLSLIQGVINTFVMFFARIIGYTVDKAIFKTERGHGPGFYIVTFLSEIVLAFLATMIVAWFSRKREFRADEAGATLADRQGMINALRRLQAESEVPNQMPDSLTAFGITTGARNTFQALFSTHPPLEVRIQALQSGRR